MAKLAASLVAELYVNSPVDLPEAQSVQTLFELGYLPAEQ